MTPFTSLTRLPRPIAWGAVILLAVALSGCFAGRPRLQNTEELEAEEELARQRRFATRPPISTTRNLYEGSLWRGAASWGNLMRDHRARYRGDLLTVTEMPKIINVPEPKVEQPAEQAAAEEQAKQPIDPVIAFLRQQQERREQIEREQNEILRSIDLIEVEVVRVLPNGNLLVRGVHPPIFRERNRVKYVVTLRGIVRPSDVDDNNTIPAPKLSKAEYKLRRLVRRSRIPRIAGVAARAAGSRRGGEFLDRLSSFLTRPRRTAAPVQ